MGSKARLPKISVNNNSSLEDEEDTDSEYGDVDILRIGYNDRDRLNKRMDFQTNRPRTALNRAPGGTAVARPWSSTLRQPDPKWGKRLLVRRQSTEDYLDEMSDEVFERVNRLSRSTAATMARDADKTVQPYVSPREKKRTREKHPTKINLEYSLRFKGGHRVRDGGNKSAFNRLYQVDSERKKVNVYSSRWKTDVPKNSLHNGKDKLQPYMSQSQDLRKTQNQGQPKSAGYPKPLRSFRQIVL